jgi:outer membrane protein W
LLLRSVEKVIGHTDANTTVQTIRFRVAQSNHKEGPYNAPTTIFTNNPYTSQTAASSIESFLGTPGIVQLQGSATSNNIPASYSSTSTILNVDTFSLSAQAQGEYFGWAETGTILVGQTSGAIAEVTNIRLIPDLGATLIGSYFIPDPNTAIHPRFETGVKTFTLIDNSTNNQDQTETLGEENYTASGTLETVQENIISVRNARVEIKTETQSERVQRTVGDQKGELIGSTVISTDTTSKAVREWYDPLAQSYQVLDETGCFLTSCDVFFNTKDDMDIPMT